MVAIVSTRQALETDPMSAPAQPAPGVDGGDPSQARIRVPAGTTAATAVGEAGLPRRGTPDAIVVVRDADGNLRDLSWVPDVDTDITPVAANTDDGRSVIRHSTAHVLAQAVQELFPQAKLGIGPPITDGFYYDFDVPEPFTPEDLAALEKRMRQIVKEGQLFDRRVYESTEQARAELANEPYKLELVDDKSGDAEIMEVGGDELTAYDNLNPAPASASGATCAADRTSRPPNTSRRSSSPAARPPTGGAIRKTPACNGSTAPRGNPRRRSTGTWSSSKRRSAATTASWVSSWTCSASPTKSVPA